MDDRVKEMLSIANHRSIPVMEVTRQELDRMAGFDGVIAVHDLHVWRLTSGMDVATAHLVTSASAQPGSVLEAAGGTLRDRFSIAHATLQIEAEGTAECQGVDW